VTVKSDVLALVVKGIDALPALMQDSEAVVALVVVNQGTVMALANGWTAEQIKASVDSTIQRVLSLADAGKG
jgi:hypothetical protein